MLKCYMICKDKLDYSKVDNALISMPYALISLCLMPYALISIGIPVFLTLFIDKKLSIATLVKNLGFCSI